MQNKAKLNRDEKSEINSVAKTFFAIFTNTGHNKPDWKAITDICIPETVIIKKDSANEVVYNLHSFIEPRKEILNNGTLTDFEESEIKEETKIIGNLAQRYSKYQKSGYLNGTYFKEYGNKLFQFIKTNNGWKINSLIWEDDKT